MNRLTYLLVACLCVSVSCGNPAKKADGVSHLQTFKQDVVPQSVITVIYSYLREHDYAEKQYQLQNIFKYATTSRGSDVYVAQLIRYEDDAQPELGGDDEISCFEILNGKVIQYQEGFSYSGAFTAEDTTRAHKDFPGIIVPYGSCYDFNQDGKRELAILSHGGIGSSLDFFVSRTNSDMKADYEYEEFVCQSQIPFWDVPDAIPQPVQWVTYKGRKGFKVYYESSDAEWPSDNSLPKPWFVGWNEKTRQFEPLEEMEE